MTRIDHAETKPAQVVSAADYQEDLRRGYCILEFQPEGERVIKDRVNPENVFRVKTKQILSFRCMRCQYDTVDSEYAPDEHKNKRTGKDLISLHVMRNQHPWPYTPFENPYGHVSEVTIEGIDNYAASLAAKEGE